MSSLEYALFQVYLFQKMRKCFDLVTIYFVAFPCACINNYIYIFNIK